MRKILFILLSAFCYLSYSQSISVGSFKLLDSDLTANTAGTMEQDQNGEVAALIKVVTTQTGFSFDCGAMGVVKTLQKPSEIWVYVPRGVKKMTIAHPQLGLLRDYYFPISIEAARTYEMVLVSSLVHTIVQQASNSQYLVIKVTPSNAIVELNNEILQNTNGIAQKFVKLGTYDYRVQAQDYHVAAGKVTIDDPNNKKILEVNLQPAFGWIEIPASEVYNGAQVFIDNTLAGTIPMKSNNLSSGEHSVKIVKELYNPFSQTVVVKDNEITQITPSLSANFSEVTITVDNDADIYVNNEKKETGSWSGKLSVGSYVLEAKKEGHQATKRFVDISISKSPQSIHLQTPLPIYGNVNITSVPSMADVFIDGKMVGQTPLFLPKVLIGKHDIVLTASGYNNSSVQIMVSKGDNKPINVVLDDKKHVPVNIECNVPDAIICVDSVMSGKISDVKTLSVGEHELKISSLGYKDKVEKIFVIDNDVSFANKFRFTLERPKVVFFSDTPVAYINIDNNGFVPLVSSEEIELSYGEHLICVKKNNNSEFNGIINIKDESDIIVSFSKKKFVTKDVDSVLFEKLYSKIIKKSYKETRNVVITHGRVGEWEKIIVTNDFNKVSSFTFIGNISERYNEDPFSGDSYEKAIRRMKIRALELGAFILYISSVTPKEGGFVRIQASAYKL